MDRDIPTFNQLIVSKINQKNLHLHQQRLQNIRSSQQSSGNTVLNMPKNRKAEQLEEERKTEIEKSNVILFNRMMKIMKRTNPSNRPPLQTSKNSRASSQFARIQEQNRTMYERIEKQKPTINNRKLFKQRQKNLNILRFLGKYSEHSLQNTNAQHLRQSQSSSRASNIIIESRNRVSAAKHYLEGNAAQQAYPKKRYQEDYDVEQEINDDDFTKIQQLIEAKRQRRSEYIRPADNFPSIEHRPDQSLEQTVPQSAKDIVLFKMSRKIGSRNYEFKVVRRHHSYEIRCCQSGLSQIMKLEFGESQGNQLLEQNDYNYRDILGRVTIDQNRIYFSNQEPQEPAEVQTNAKSYFHSKSKQMVLKNISHISQQNEEDSFRPQIQQQNTVDQREDQRDNELDSLGEQEEEQQFEDFPKDIPQMAIRGPIEPEDKSGKVIIKPAVYDSRAKYEGYDLSQQNGGYEEALDEDIL